MTILKKKWKAYQDRAESYNNTFTPIHMLETPTLDEVKGFRLDNPFWNLGQLSHPEEPWATDSNIQKGIQAYLVVTHCNDELQ